MMNTLIDKQRMGCKIVHDIEDYERFDIVIAKETNGVQIVKRIIGLPGEEVFIDENGNIYIDGNILEEHYGKETIKDPGNAFHIVTLGEDEFFLLGDNRNNSLDSRFDIVGPVPMERMRGKVVWYKDHSKPSK
jgi:signal peptidase I